MAAATATTGGGGRHRQDLMLLLLVLVLLVVFACCFVICEGGFVLFLMSGAVEGMGVVRGLIVTRVAGNGLEPTGGAHIAIALRELTGLQELYLDGACLHDCGCCGVWGVG